MRPIRRLPSPPTGLPPTPLHDCRACDLLVWPLPEASRAALQAAATYTKPTHEARWRAERIGFFAHVLDETAARMGEPLAGRRVLDFGCAYGHLLDAVAARGGTGLGIEQDTKLRDLVGSRGHAVAATLETAAGPFDAAFLLDSLYYVHDPVTVLEQIRARLRPGGTIVARVTNRNPLVRWVSPDLQGDARLGFSVRSLRTALAQAGFEGIAIRPDVGTGKRLPERRARFYWFGGVASWLVGYRRVFTPGLFAWGRCPA